MTDPTAEQPPPPYTAGDLYVPEQHLNRIRYAASAPPESHSKLASFRPPKDMHPGGQDHMVCRAFHHLAQSMAENLPNGPALLTAIDKLYEAMDAAVVAAQVGQAEVRALREAEAAQRQAADGD